MRAAARLLLALVAGLPLAGAAADDAQPAAQALLERAFDNLYADDYIQVFEMSTRIGEGRALERTLQIARRQSEKPGKALVRFLEPFDIRNTAVLILERDGEADETFVYLPALRMTRRLSAAQRDDSFFGTDLTYEDMEPKRADDYVAARLEGEGSDAGCTEIEIRPKESVESAYERLHACVAPDTGVFHWIDYYRRGERIKRLESDLSQVKVVGGRHIPYRMTIEKAGSRSSTVLDVQRYERMAEIPDALFSTSNLQHGSADRDRSRSKAADAAERADGSGASGG